MPINKGFTLNIKSNNNNYVNLYPNTIKSQIIDWNIGEVYGPYTITLYSSNWENNKQIVSLDGVEETDIIFCNKAFSDLDPIREQIIQDNNYALLLTNGIQSLQNQIEFSCSSPPTVDLNLQVFWTR